MENEKLTKKDKKIMAIGSFVAIVPNVIAYLIYSYNIVLSVFLIILGVCGVFSLLCYLLKNKLINVAKEKGIKEGQQMKSVVVFTVSAILIDSKHKIALVKGINDKQYKQPGSQYSKSDQESPFEKIKKTITKETGLAQDHFEYIKFGKDILVNDEITLQDFVSELKDFTPEMFNDINDMKDNILIPAPFLIMHQKQNNPNNVNPIFHCDMFYAFKLTDKGQEHEDKKTPLSSSTINMLWVDENDLKENPLVKYRDLIVVYYKFKKLYQKTKFPTLITHYCNFSGKEKTLLLRLTKNCNLKCVYCLLGSNLENKQDDTITLDQIEQLGQKVKLKGIKKIVITGGEPFMVTNLVDIVFILSKYCDSISICTNGTITRNINMLDDLSERTKLKKIVISLDSCKEDEYEKLMGANDFLKVKEFITTLNTKNYKEKIQIQINIVAHDLNNVNQSAVGFWKKNNIHKISVSCPMGGPYSYTKQQLVDKCNDICKGEYGDVDFIKKFELHLPECKNKCNGEQINGNIFSASRNESGDFELIDTCIDKEKYGNIR